MKSHELYRSRWTVFSMSVPIFIETALQMMVPNVDQFMLSRYSQDSVARWGMIMWCLTWSFLRWRCFPRRLPSLSPIIGVQGIWER